MDSVYGDDGMWFWNVVSVVGYGLAYQALHKLRDAVPAWMELGSRRSRSYVVSTIHSGVEAICVCVYLPNALVGDARGAVPMLAVGFGYFLTDLVFTLPDLRAHPVEVVHHAMTFGVVLAAILDRSLRALTAVFYVVELSTPLFNVCWFLQKAGRQHTLVYQLTLAVFVALFLVTRLMWLPWRTYLLWLDPAQLQASGYAVYALVVLNLMQFYWLLQYAYDAIAARPHAKASVG